MNLLPAVLISYAQLGPVVQEQLAAAGVTPHHSRVEQWSQPSAVLVVGGAPKIQERLGKVKKKKKMIITQAVARYQGPVGPRDLGNPTQGQSQSRCCHNALE